MSSIFEGNLWETYKQKLGNIESSNTYNIIGGFNDDYDGKYQFGEIAKKDIGIGHTPKERESFRNDPKAQEKALTKFTKLNYKRLMKNPKFAKMNTDQQMGVLAYAHNQGAGGASNWLNTGIEGKDGFGTLGTKYYDAFTETPAFGNEELKMKLVNYSKPSPLSLTKSVPQMRPENLQQPNIPQLRPDNLSIKEQEVPQPQSFGQAFSQARQQHGGDGGVFEWNGNKYTTDIAKEVPAVAEPMFPREEFVPTVPPRVADVPGDRSGVPPFQGIKLEELGFNSGTTSVPGYKDGSNFISNFFSKYFTPEVVKQQNQMLQEQEIINSVLDKNILDQENKEKAIMEAAQINAQRNAPAVPKLPDEKIISAPIKLGVNDYTNQGISLNPPTEYADVEQARRLKQSIIDNSIADGSYGDPQAGYSQQPIPMVVNATPPGYDSGPVGTSVNAVPPGYDAGPVVTSVNAVPPGYNAGPSVIPLAEQFPTPGNDSMYVPENNTVSLFDSKGIHIPSGLTLDEMDIDQLKILVNNVQGDVDSVMIQKEIMKRVNQDYTNAQDMANQELQKDGAVSNSTLKTLDNVKTEIARQKEIETNLVFQDDWENRKKIRDKNRAEESYAKDLNKYKEHNLNLDLNKEVPIIKENVTVADESKEIDPKDNTTAILPNGKNTDLNSQENNEINKNTPNSVKEQVGGMLQTFFGLETSDVTRAIGFYLASRAAGYSHEGSMRWAGRTVLKQAENRNILNSKKADATLTAFAKVRGNYTPEAGSKITKLLTEGKLVEAQALMARPDSKTTRGKLGIDANAAGDFYMIPGYTTAIEVFEGAGGNRYTKVVTEKDGKKVETYKPISSAEMGQLRIRGDQDDDTSRLSAVRAYVEQMPAALFKREGIDKEENVYREAGIFSGRSQEGVTADIMAYARKQRELGLRDDPIDIMQMVGRGAELAESMGITKINAETIIDMQVVGGDTLFDQNKISKDGELVAPSKIKSFTSDFQDILGNDRNLITTTMNTAATQFTPDMTIDTIKAVPLYSELNDSQKAKVDSAPSTFMALSLLTAYANKPK